MFFQVKLLHLSTHNLIIMSYFVLLVNKSYSQDRELTIFPSCQFEENDFQIKADFLRTALPIISFKAKSNSFEFFLLERLLQIEKKLIEFCERTILEASGFTTLTLTISLESEINPLLKRVIILTPIVYIASLTPIVKIFSPLIIFPVLFILIKFFHHNFRSSLKKRKFFRWKKLSSRLLS